MTVDEIAVMDGDKCILQLRGVIDEDGEVHVVDENEHLPVINETFQTGNIYVGKYADVMGVANDLYPSLLGAWINYLKYGKRYYIEYYEYSGKDMDQLENEVMRRGLFLKSA